MLVHFTIIHPPQTRQISLGFVGKNKSKYTLWTPGVMQGGET